MVGTFLESVYRRTMSRRPKGGARNNGDGTNDRDNQQHETSIDVCYRFGAKEDRRCPTWPGIRSPSERSKCRLPSASPQAFRWSVGSGFCKCHALGSWLPSVEQRSLAAALAVPGSTIGGIDAAVIHKMPLPKSLRQARADVYLLVDSKRIVRIKGIEARRMTRVLPSKPWHGVKLATPIATLVSLGGVLPTDDFERALDHCVINKLVTATGLVTMLEGLSPQAVPNRIAMLSVAMERLPSRGTTQSRVMHRSKLEQTVRRWLDVGGLEGWCANYSVLLTTGKTIEIDFAWPDQKVALEVSPFHTHGSRETQERDAQRRRLLVLLGWRIVEATDADLLSETAFEATRLTLMALLGRTN